MPQLIFPSRIFSFVLLIFLGCTVVPVAAQPADKPGRTPEPVELVGRAADYWHTRNWRSYYWREDFTFLLHEEPGGKVWRIISREPTPAYGWRMGTTYTGLAVDWKAKPRVKVIGVTGVDRQPAEFYDQKLNEPNLATALVVYVEAKPDTWNPFYVNNWFHKWGDKADRVIHELYADKGPPYNIYGFARAQAAPFNARSQAIIDQHKDNPSLMFHGLVRATKDNAFGYEIELIDLIGRNVKSGGAIVLHGDAKAIPKLDGRKP